MNIRFVSDDDIPAVARFNQRLREGGRGEEQITLRPELPGEARYRPAGFPVYRRMMIAEDGREVRAAAMLYYNNIFIHGKRQDCCWLDMPISEGIIDRRYSLAIIQLLKTASRYEPFMMSTGAGPVDKDSFRLLTKLDWRNRAVPFFFYPVNSHEAWVKACRRSGMLAGPESYYHFVSPGGSPLFEDTCPPREIHMARGHSDGMWSLI